MGRVSPGRLGGVALISSISMLRARATRGAAGVSRSTVIWRGVQVMVPARPRVIVWRVIAGAPLSAVRARYDIGRSSGLRDSTRSRDQGLRVSSRR